MNDEASIRAIREAPDDDAPRLAYADLLEERGDPQRAEFIRLQCWLSATPPDHPDWDRNWDREQELLDVFSNRIWSIPLADGRDLGWSWYDRGFPSVIVVYRPDEFVDQAEYIAASTPTDRLRIGWTLDGDVQRIISCPQLAGIRELWTNNEGGTFPADRVAEFLRSPFVQNLRRLDFSGSQWDRHHECEVLATEPVLPDLRHLVCGEDYPVDIETILALLHSPHRRKLTGFTFWYASASDIAALCSCPELSRIRHLDLGDCTLGDNEARHLIESPYMGGIEYLSVDEGGSGVELSPSGRAALRQRFGHRLNLSNIPYVRGPESGLHEWKLMTGRPR